MTAGRVVAVVVTYNRRSELATAIAAVIDQTRRPDRIVVVDNASTDGTADYLAHLDSPVPVDVIRPERNTGGAGGFFLGMRHAYSAGADFLWICDDDSVAYPDALERLLSGYRRAADLLDEPPVFACSLVTWTDGTMAEMNVPLARADWPRLMPREPGLALVAACTFVSVLVPREQVTRHGLPDPAMFIWFDDVEYTTRLSEHGPGVAVLASVVEHRTHRNRAVHPAQVTDADLWKFQLGVRNEVATAVWRGKRLRALRILHRTWSQSGAGDVPVRLRVALVRAGLEGFRLRRTPAASPPHSQSSSSTP